MGQCTQCIKRDCGFPPPNYKGQTPEEYTNYLKEVSSIFFPLKKPYFFKKKKLMRKYQKNPNNYSPDKLTIEKDLQSSSYSENDLNIEEDERKNTQKAILSKYTISYSNILTPCSTQRNLENVNFLSRRNLEKSPERIFNSPQKAQGYISSKTSEEQYPSFFSGEDGFNSKEDLEKMGKFSVFNGNFMQRKSQK